MEFQAGSFAVAVTVPDRAVLEHNMRDRFARGQGFALATLNLDHLEKLRVEGPFRDAYAAQEFVTADGNPIVWCAALAGRSVELLPGSDLILPLARIAAGMGVAVGLVGSTEDSLAGATEALERAVPGLRVVERIAPPMGFDPDGDTARAVLNRLDAAGVGLCFLALGAPKQERLAALGRQVTPGIGFASIGAGLDFLSGKQARAPEWVRRIAMEWAWRMLSDPRRMARRYILSALILPGHLWRSWRMRQR